MAGIVAGATALQTALDTAPSMAHQRRGGRQLSFASVRIVALEVSSHSFRGAFSILVRMAVPISIVPAACQLVAYRHEP